MAMAISGISGVSLDSSAVPGAVTMTIPRLKVMELYIAINEFSSIETTYNWGTIWRHIVNNELLMLVKIGGPGYPSTAKISAFISLTNGEQQGISLRTRHCITKEHIDTMCSHLEFVSENLKEHIDG